MPTSGRRAANGDKQKVFFNHWGRADTEEVLDNVKLFAGVDLPNEFPNFNMTDLERVSYQKALFGGLVVLMWAA